VLLQLRLGSVFAELFSKRPLVDSAIALKDGGRDPWLEYKPAACVYTTDFLIAIRELWGAFNGLTTCFVSLDKLSDDFCDTYRGDAELKANRLTAAAEKYCPTIV
jgi:hypothetical protein